MLRELPVEAVVPLPVDTGAQADTGRRFTRVTFVGPTRRADVSVPDNLPAALVIEQVRPLLDATADGPWVLTSPAGGDLGPEAALGEHGVLDGELLYLRRHGDGYLPPFAEDAAEEAAGAGRPAGSWTEGATRFVLAAAAALWLGLAGPLLVWRLGPEAAAAPVLVLTVALLVGAAGAGLAGHDLIGGALGWSLLPAVASAAVALTAGSTGAVRVIATAGAVAAAAGVAGLLGARGQHGLGWAALIGTVTVALAVQVWAGLVVAGLTAGRAAAVVGLALVALQSALPRVAIELAGLGRLADAVADGGAVRGDRIQLAAGQARELLAALLAGTGVAVALAAGRLAAEGGVPGSVLAALLGAALLFRARRYSSTVHVLPLVLTGLAALFAVAAAQVQVTAAGPSTILLLLLAAGGGLAALAAARPATPSRARARVAMERAETAVLLACGAIVLAAFDAYGLAFAVVR
jgi:type VII secretion integral membrane protein EccD